MASSFSILKYLLNINNCVIEDCQDYQDDEGKTYFNLIVRPVVREQCRCPLCHHKCPRYDRAKTTRQWRSLNLNGSTVTLTSNSCRITCPQHGIVTASVPWAFPNSGFTKDFDTLTAWLARFLSKRAVSEYMGIDWKTVTHCINRVFGDDNNPDLAGRMQDLKTLFFKEELLDCGKIITIILNHETNSIVCAVPGGIKEAADIFYNMLNEKEQTQVKVFSNKGLIPISDFVLALNVKRKCRKCGRKAVGSQNSNGLLYKIKSINKKLSCRCAGFPSKICLSD